MGSTSFYRGETDEVNEAIQGLYRKFLSKTLRADELADWQKHVKEDKPIRLTEQFNNLKNLGFSSLELLWLYGNETVYCAKR